MTSPRPAIPGAAQENLRFLVGEVSSQCQTLRRSLSQGDAELAQRVIDRSGYAANLKARVQASCTEAIAGTPADDAAGRLRLTAFSELAHQLERITDKLREAARQLQEVDDIALLQPQRYKAPLTRIRETLTTLADSLPLAGDTGGTELARSGERLQQQAEKLRSRYVAEMVGAKHRHLDTLSRGILIAAALGQVADSLLRLSEALLTLRLGQPMSIDRFNALREFMAQHADYSDSALHNLADTRSGSSITGLTPRNPDKPAAVFKEGLRKKLKEERRGVESWHSVYPGLAPRILAYQKRGESAALLIEHLSGVTFEHLLVNGTEAQLEAALKALLRTLKEVWKATRSDTAAAANFMAQLSDRLADVRATHPDLVSARAAIGRYRALDLEVLINRAGKREKAVRPPFSVYIHGDFNIDNIIYDPDNDRIHFIDLHRSRAMDYVQDVSVFMVSCRRLPARDPKFRQRMLTVIESFDRAVRVFARKQYDDYYDFRLALGLARSFASSTRFIADRSVARQMINRSRYLLERTLDVEKGQESRFRLPTREMFID